MIRVINDFEEYCENCSNLDVETETLSFGESPAIIYVRCANKEKCKRLVETLRKRLNEDNEND